MVSRGLINGLLLVLVWYPIEIQNVTCLGSVLNADMHVLVSISDWYRFNICIFVQIELFLFDICVMSRFLYCFLFLVLVVPYVHFCAHCAQAKRILIIQTPALSSVGGSRRVATHRKKSIYVDTHALTAHRTYVIYVYCHALVVRTAGTPGQDRPTERGDQMTTEHGNKDMCWRRHNTKQMATCCDFTHYSIWFLRQHNLTYYIKNKAKCSAIEQRTHLVYMHILNPQA